MGKVTLLLFLLCGAARAEPDPGISVAQLRAFAYKWERNANSLLDNQCPGPRQEMLGRAMGFYKAAEDLRVATNEQLLPWSRERPRPPPWPRGSVKSLALCSSIIPGLGGAPPERVVGPGGIRPRPPAVTQ